MGSNKIDLIAIKTSKGYYISDNIEDSSYFNTRIFSNKYDVRVTKTYHKDWGFCEKLPSIIYKKEPNTYTNKRWELKAGYPESELIPKVMYEKPDDEIYGLYISKSDVVEGRESEEPTNVEIIVEQDDFEIKQVSSFVSHNLIDRITTPSVLLATKATKISSDESFKIIREFVKRNYNSSCVRITSDYDFHFQVNRIIKHEPEEYKKDISNYRSKKSKWVIDYRRQREIKLLELQLTKGNYNGASFAPEFTGINYDDCISKLNKYLEKLRIEVTTPLEECPHCKGLGIKSN